MTGEGQEVTAEQGSRAGPAIQSPRVEETSHTGFGYFSYSQARPGVKSPEQGPLSHNCRDNHLLSCNYSSSWGTPQATRDPSA